MKKNLIFLLIALLAIAFLSANCGGNSDNASNIIEAENVSGNTDDIVTVKAIIANYPYVKPGLEPVLATADFENKGFKLKLPKTVDSKNLQAFITGFESGYESWLKVSDTKAQGATIRTEAYNNEDVRIGDFFWQGTKDGSWYNVTATYFYADRKFTVKGKTEAGIAKLEYDCSFKKGWNIIYGSGLEPFDIIVTTQKPADVKFDWFYDDSGIIYFANQNSAQEVEMLDEIPIPAIFKYLIKNFLPQ